MKQAVKIALLIIVGLTFWVAIATAGSVFLSTKTSPTPTTNSFGDLIKVQTKPTQFDPSPVIDLTELARLVNIERTKLYLSQLQYDPLLNQSAQEKCNDMVAKDYWSHNAPDGTEPWVFIQRHNVYKLAGENLAYGYYTPKDMVDGWMKSPTHRDNIVKPTYNRVGYAQCVYPISSKQGENTLVVQFFTD